MRTHVNMCRRPVNTEPPACISLIRLVSVCWWWKEMAAEPRPTELCENIVTTSSVPFKRCIVPLRAVGELALCYYTVHVSSALIAPTTTLDVFQGMHGGRSATLRGISGLSLRRFHCQWVCLLFTLCRVQTFDILLTSDPHPDPHIIIFSLYSLLRVSVYVILKCICWCVSVSLGLKHALKYERRVLGNFNAPVVAAWFR